MQLIRTYLRKLGLPLLATLTLVLIAYVATTNRTLGFDDAVLRAIHRLANHSLDTFFSFITNFGSPLTVLLGGVFGCLLFTQRKDYRRGLAVLVAIGGSELLNAGLKALYGRQRPSLWHQLIHEPSFSFPSGHAMGSGALAIVLVWLCWYRPYRRLVMVTVVIYVLVIGLSRLYLGVHYPTDIIGGWLGAIAWCGFTIAWYRGLFGPKRRV